MAVRYVWNVVDFEAYAMFMQIVYATLCKN